MTIMTSDPHIDQFAIERVKLPEPIERLYQCLAFIYQPELTLFISLSQVA